MSGQIDSSTLDEIVAYALGFCPDVPARIDWDSLLYRIEDVFGIDLGGDMLDPEIKKIKRAILKAR